MTTTPPPVPDAPETRTPGTGTPETSTPGTSTPETSAPGADGPATGGPGWLIRPAAPGDEAALLTLIRELAVYEREPDAVATTTEDLSASLFADQPLAHAFVAQDGATGEVFGLALWFVTFSTWTGRHGIWLEDLFVRPERRGLGAGRALLARLARECVARGYARLDWSVLDWNSPAQGFYRSLGARPLEDWTTWRVDGVGLAALGSDGRVGDTADERRR